MSAKGITITDICGDYSLNIPNYNGIGVMSLYFNSNRNALNVKRIIEVDDSVPNVATVCDMVEVVRCKDCKFLYCFSAVDREFYCRNHKGMKGILNIVEEEPFCSCGVRKQESEVSENERDIV